MSIRKITAAVAPSLTALGLGAPAASACDPSQWGRARAEVAGDPSQWGRARAEVAGDPSQWNLEKVNEYEGQHR